MSSHAPPRPAPGHDPLHTCWKHPLQRSRGRTIVQVGEFFIEYSGSVPMESNGMENRIVAAYRLLLKTPSHRDRRPPSRELPCVQSRS